MTSDKLSPNVNLSTNVRGWRFVASLELLSGGGWNHHRTADGWHVVTCVAVFTHPPYYCLSDDHNIPQYKLVSCDDIREMVSGVEVWLTSTSQHVAASACSWEPDQALDMDGGASKSVNYFRCRNAGCPAIE